MVDRLVNSEANRKRIQYVEQCFGASGQPLLIPGRVLVGEGVLTKLCRKRPKQRQFFLLNDVLIYGNIVISKRKYNKQKILNLENVRIEPYPDLEELKNGWQIISPSKSFIVFAATPTEKTEWMAHISKCVKDLLAKSGKTQAVEVSPVWVPDSEAKSCMSCKTQFTLINRRHHCRKCGKVVCDNCSQKKWEFPEQSNKPQRVCNACYTDLNQLLRRGSQVAEQSAGTDSMMDSDSDDSDDGTTPENGADGDEAHFYGDNKA